VIIAFMVVVLFAGVGIAIDAGLGYYYNTSAERAAAAAALSGVIFMPYQFDSSTATPAGSRNDASDRAIDEATKNGFRNGDPIGSVVVTPRRSGRLQQAAGDRRAHRAGVLHEHLWFGPIPHQPHRHRDLSAAHHAGPERHPARVHRVSARLWRQQLLLPTRRGWATDRVQGDAFTRTRSAAAPAPPTTFTGSAAHRPPAQGPIRGCHPAARGGYNFLINIGPGGGQIQVYNAAFAPDLDNSSDGTRAS